MQARDHVQEPAVAAAIHGRVQQLGFLAAHRSSGIHAGIAAGHRENPVRDSHGLKVAPGGYWMIKQFASRNRLFAALLAGTAIAACIAIGAEQVGAFGFRGGGFGGFHGRGGFGGFHGGGEFHGGGLAGGGPRLGDSSFADRSHDAGFGQGGFGNVHSASNFSDHADTYRQSHPEYQHNASQFRESHPEAKQNV